MWWLRLGSNVERIEPGKPQQNGRQERFHRTLKAATAAPPEATMDAQQRAYDVFRRIYNEERPHEPLHQQPPASAYYASARRYPRRLVRFATAAWDHAKRVDKNGCFSWNAQRVFISTALAREEIDLLYDGEREEWDVVFGPLAIGTLHETASGAAFNFPSTNNTGTTKCQGGPRRAEV